MSIFLIIFLGLMFQTSCGRSAESARVSLSAIAGDSDASGDVNRQKIWSSEIAEAIRNSPLNPTDWVGDTELNQLITTPEPQPTITGLERYQLIYEYPLDRVGQLVDPRRIRIAEDDGFKPEDFKQGDIGDCTFVAALSAIADADPAHLRYLIAVARDGRGHALVDERGYPIFRARFVYSLDGTSATVWQYLLDAKLPTSEQGNGLIRKQPFLPPRETNDGRLLIGGALLEKAFARFLEETNFLNVKHGRVELPSNGQGYKDLDEGAWPEDVFELLTGKSPSVMSTRDDRADVLKSLLRGARVAAIADLTYDNAQPPDQLGSGARIISGLASDAFRRAGVMEFQYLQSTTETVIRLRDIHSYTVLASQRETARFRNAWGMKPDQVGYQKGYGMFEMLIEDAAEIFSEITIVDLSP